MQKKLPTGRYWSIAPIVGGVMLATFTEPNYHPIGFWTAAIGCWATGKKKRYYFISLDWVFFLFHLLCCLISPHSPINSFPFISNLGTPLRSLLEEPQPTQLVVLHCSMGCKSAPRRLVLHRVFFYCCMIHMMAIFFFSYHPSLRPRDLFSSISTFIESSCWSCPACLLSSSVRVGIFRINKKASDLFFLLSDVASFFVIQKTSSLTYTVAGNFKVAFSIIVSVIIFRNEVRWCFFFFKSHFSPPKKDYFLECCGLSYYHCWCMVVPKRQGNPSKELESRLFFFSQENITLNRHI